MQFVIEVRDVSDLTLPVSQDIEGLFHSLVAFNIQMEKESGNFLEPHFLVYSVANNEIVSFLYFFFGDKRQIHIFAAATAESYKHKGLMKAQFLTLFALPLVQSANYFVARVMHPLTEERIQFHKNFTNWFVENGPPGKVLRVIGKEIFTEEYWAKELVNGEPPVVSQCSRTTR